MTRYAAIIPARAGSKGIPGKNLKAIAGKPLIVWSVESALACRRMDAVVVSSDGDDILEAARRGGAEALRRPAALATDAAGTEPTLVHAVQWLESVGRRPDALVLLQPTSPLRRAGTLDKALDLFEKNGADSLLTVCESHAFFWKNPAAPEALYDFRHRPRRQDIPPADRWYRENGSIYVTRTDVLLRENNRLGGRIAMLPVSEEESVEIDSEADFAIVEKLLERERPS
ncbi:MAG: acylneuraminate cytidylyltransferase family protein [Elusimicrobia bacterium]|nr:acylneuraminate cytidylyltransferase family protein [Elusimicrobiota bacterium]